MSVIEIGPELVEEHGLTPEEYQLIRSLLGRDPNLTELGIFSVMWSEHCSYKSSRVHLKKLPTAGPQVIEGPGENAGVVDIGQGMAAVFKIESHNHPSFIEPYQGAATGVGGILRDIFTMGARPAALMNSLHFGPLQQPRNQLIMEGVVAGIAGYGNCIGVPTIGGEVHFHPRYSVNPLVNAFCLGIAPADRIFRAQASGIGNPVIYVGAKTGRDGIHGATMASEEFSEDSEAKRPTVQVGDPFLEKLLLEACLEAMKSGAVVGIQDMGAAGLTCSTCEMGGKSNLGIEIELDRVPQREPGMTPYEIMLSESQERMLLVAEKGREEEVLRIFRKWDLDAVVIGTVQEGDRLTVKKSGNVVASIPNRALTEEAPVYRRPATRPAELDAISDWRELDLPEPEDYGNALLQMLSSEHLCSREWVYQQYDHMVRTGTVVLPGSDAAVIRIEKGQRGLAMSLDSAARFSRLDPRKGAILAVAEGCRNLACSGARPLAATNCLNFASPENPGTMWQFAETIEGMRQACEVFQTPITGGNVSFYNETNGVGILATPVIGMVGLIDDVSKTITSDFKADGDQIFLLGETREELGGSIYLEILGLGPAGPCPEPNLKQELQLQQLLLDLAAKQLISSAHDLSEGGLGPALAESCFPKGLGAVCRIESALRPDRLLFSETPGRALVSVRPAKVDDFLAAARDFPVSRLGAVGTANLEILYNGEPLLTCSVSDAASTWNRPLNEVFRH
ncbi:MAG TPA: phosphoribosylformylglycinamidine synthase subunit PurL [Acidobacteriota bacterium]|nr:phosphoribosylformylglycinamidine synthase subunit PurL [Acidobacteriota bacterium]